jgi:uncharacterized protein (DUF697 family)
MSRPHAPGADEQSAVLPRSRRAARAAALRARRTVHRRALVSAVATAVPVPGIDIAVDLGVLMKMLHDVNAEFGLTPAQIARLAPRRRLSVNRAVAALGSSFVGRVITQRVLLTALRSVARRIATKTVLRFVPLAGQAIAATISYAAIRYIGMRHVDDCLAVAEALLAPAPARQAS